MSLRHRLYLGWILHNPLTMTIANLAPTYTDPSHLADAVKSQGFGVLSPSGLATFLDLPRFALDVLKPDWDDLPPDNFLKDGGHYRRRRHSSFIVTGKDIKQVPHRAHYQPLEYNALHGGMLRMFEPMKPEVVAQPALKNSFSPSRRSVPSSKASSLGMWKRTSSASTPPMASDGRHRRARTATAPISSPSCLRGARISAWRKPHLRIQRSSWPAFYADRTMDAVAAGRPESHHESTPIQPTAEGGHRDTLVLTFRAGGFLEKA